MPLVDGTGMPWAHQSTLKAGDYVKVDSGFDCIPDGSVRAVEKDEEGRLFIACDEGRHYLDGQLDFDGCGAYVGLWHASCLDAGFVPTGRTLKINQLET